MIKRFLVVLLIALMLVPPIAVYADMVWGNDFQYQNHEKIQWLERKSFIANGPDGYVVPQQKPGEAEETFIVERAPWIGDSIEAVLPTYQNGQEIVVAGVYIHNGKFWGIMESGHSVYLPGWIPMDHLLVIYTHKDFEEENKNNFYTYTGNLKPVQSSKRLTVWQWPGSDREKRVLNNNLVLRSISSDRAFKDAEEREWIHVTIGDKYWWPEYDGWVCLSDPENKSNIPSFSSVPKPIKWSPDGIIDWSSDDAIVYPPVEPSGLTRPDTTDRIISEQTLLIIVSSFVLVLGTAVLIIFRKRNKNGR